MVKNLPPNAYHWINLGSVSSRKDPWKRNWQPTPEFLPGKSHGQRSPVGYSPCRRLQKRYNLATKQPQNWNNFQETLLTLLYRAHSRLFFCFISFFQMQPNQCLGSQPTVWSNLLSYSLPFFLITCNSLPSNISPLQLWNRPSPLSMVIFDQWVCLKRSG